MNGTKHGQQELSFQLSFSEVLGLGRWGSSTRLLSSSLAVSPSVAPTPPLHRATPWPFLLRFEWKGVVGRLPSSGRLLHDVWSWNFHYEPRSPRSGVTASTERQVRTA